MRRKCGGLKYDLSPDFIHQHLVWKRQLLVYPMALVGGKEVLWKIIDIIKLFIIYNDLNNFAQKFPYPYF